VLEEDGQQLEYELQFRRRYGWANLPAPRSPRNQAMSSQPIDLRVHCGKTGLPPCLLEASDWRICVVGRCAVSFHPDDPIVEFRLLRAQNFAIASVFYFLFWVQFVLIYNLDTRDAANTGRLSRHGCRPGLGSGAMDITVLAPVCAMIVQRRT
jgi:hypothetical protein